MDAASTPLPPPPYSLAPGPAVPPPPHAAQSPGPVGPALVPAPAPPAVALPESHDRRLLRLAAGFYGVVMLFAVGYATFSGKLPELFGDEGPAASSLVGAVVVGFGIVGLCRLGNHLFPAVARAADALGELIGPVTWKGALGLALLSGVGEELLFRGALWPHLRIWGTTFLFALVHVVPKKALLGYPLFALGGGLLLGLLRLSGGNVLAPIVAHVIVNAMNLAWIGRRRAHALGAVAA